MLTKAFKSEVRSAQYDLGVSTALKINLEMTNVLDISVFATNSEHQSEDNSYLEGLLKSCNCHWE